MNRYIKLLALMGVLAAGLFALAGCSDKKDEPTPGPDPVEPVNTTVLVYMAASNSLGVQLNDSMDIKEMQRAARAGHLNGGRLLIDAPSVCPEPLTTNDIAEILPDGSFKILGRTDNIICSSGLKFQLEALEEKLAPLPVPFLLTAVPDARLGQALALIYEGADADSDLLLRLCRERLGRHEQPRYMLRAAHLPRTETGKPARKEAARLAEQLAELV